MNGNVDEKNVLKIYDYFYHKEHLFLVKKYFILILVYFLNNFTAF